MHAHPKKDIEKKAGLKVVLGRKHSTKGFRKESVQLKKLFDILSFLNEKKVNRVRKKCTLAFFLDVLQKGSERRCTIEEKKTHFHFLLFCT